MISESSSYSAQYGLFSFYFGNQVYIKCYHSLVCLFSWHMWVHNDGNDMNSLKGNLGVKSDSPGSKAKNAVIFLRSNGTTMTDWLIL